jgi:hypothetical protein
MSDHPESGFNSGLNALISFAKADFSNTVSLFFAPVTAVASGVAKAVRGELDGQNVKSTERKVKLG